MSTRRLVSECMHTRRSQQTILSESSGPTLRWFAGYQLAVVLTLSHQAFKTMCILTDTHKHRQKHLPRYNDIDGDARFYNGRHQKEQRKQTTQRAHIIASSVQNDVDTLPDKHKNRQKHMPRHNDRDGYARPYIMAVTKHNGGRRQRNVRTKST